jgi:hypothetical protein
MTRTNKRKVSVSIRTSGSVSQMGYLVPAGGYFPLAGSHNGTETPLLGPFQYDWHRNRFSPLDRRDIETESLVQGRYPNNTDSQVSHSWIIGHLSLDTRTEVYQLPKSTIFEDFGDASVYVVEGAAVVNVDESGERLDTINRFSCSGVGIVSTHPPLLTEYSVTNYYRDPERDPPYGEDELGIPLYLYIASRGKATRVVFEPVENGEQTSLESVEIVFNGDETLSEGRVSLPVRHNVLSGGEIWEWEEIVEFEFFPIEPAFTVPFDSPNGTCPAIETIRARLAWFVSLCRAQTPSDGCFYATLSAVEAFRILHINGLAFVSDAIALKGFLDPLIKLLKKPLVIKNWSQLILWLKYGVKLSIQDYKALGEALISLRKLARNLRKYREIRQHLQTRYGTFHEPIDVRDDDGNTIILGTHRSNARVCAWPVFPKEVDDLTLLLSDLDFRITSVNVWDLFTYSFVVDWFVGVSDLLSQVDYTMVEIDTLKVRELVHSARNKASAVKSAFYTPETPFRGVLWMETYDRFVSFKLPAPPFRLGAPSYLRHWWEEVLIYLSRRK